MHAKASCVLVAAFALCIATSAGRPALACSTPVYQYALENWYCDFYRATVFHEGPLTEADQALLDAFRKDLIQQEPAPNLDLRTVDVSANEDEEIAKLYEAVQPPETPWMVVQYPFSTYNEGVIWSGALNHAVSRGLVESPARREVARRLLEGEVGVWVLLESGDADADDAAAKLLREQLDEMEEVLEFEPGMEDYFEPYGYPEEQGAEGDAAPEPQAPEAPPIKFSVVLVSRSDPAEQTLVKTLMGSEPGLEEYAGGPIAFPVFGRGRILAALAGEVFNKDNIEFVCGFLVGPCLCTVGRPGTDMLLAADWDAAVWGWSPVAEALPPLTALFPTAVAPQPDEPTPEPEVIDETIAIPEPADEAAPQGSKVARNVGITLAAAVALILVGTLVLRRRD